MGLKYSFPKHRTEGRLLIFTNSLLAFKNKAYWTLQLLLLPHNLFLLLFIPSTQITTLNKDTQSILSRLTTCLN